MKVVLNVPYGRNTLSVLCNILSSGHYLCTPAFWAAALDWSQNIQYNFSILYKVIAITYFKIYNS